MLRRMLQVLRLKIVVGLCLSMFNVFAIAKPIVMVSDEWCPYICTPEEQDKGYVVEVVQAAFMAMSQPTQFEIQPFSRALKSVQQNKIDIVLAVNHEQLERYQLQASNQPVGHYSNDFYVEKNDLWQYERPRDLYGKQLAIIRGYSYGVTLDNFLPLLAGVYRASGASPLEMNLKRLSKGRVNVLLGNRLVVDYVAHREQLTGQVRYAGTEGPPVALYIGFSQHAATDGLVQLYEQGLGLIKASGQYREILERYQVAQVF